MKQTYQKVKERKGEFSSDYVQKLQHAHLFTEQETISAIIESLDPANKIVPKDGDSLLFEVFSRGGKEYIKVTLEGKPLRINGDAAGSMEVGSFWDFIYL